MAPRRALKKTPKAKELAAQAIAAAEASHRIRIRVPTTTPPAAPASQELVAPAITSNIAYSNTAPSNTQAIASAALELSSGQEQYPPATKVRLPTPPAPRRQRTPHELLIDIRVYLDLEEVKTQTYMLSLF